MWGNFRLVPEILIGLGAILGAQLGASISRRIEGTWIIRLLSVALIAIGIKLV